MGVQLQGCLGTVRGLSAEARGRRLCPAAPGVKVGRSRQDLGLGSQIQVLGVLERAGGQGVRRKLPELQLDGAV